MDKKKLTYVRLYIWRREEVSSLKSEKVLLRIYIFISSLFLFLVTGLLRANKLLQVH